MILNKQLETIINKKLKNNGWSLIKTTKVKPTGYKGYEFTQYDTDNFTIAVELKAKTAGEFARKIIEWYSIKI